MSLDLTTPNALPAEFNDRLAEQVLLQPDAEYIFARWLYSALMQDAYAEMDPDAWDIVKVQMLEGRLAQSGAAANLAQAMSNGMGGPLMLSQGVGYPDMVRFVREAKQPGEVIKINRPTFINGATTPANRQASPTTKLFGTNSQIIGMEQAKLTIVEYLGPGDPITGNPTPISIPSFTAHRSAHDLWIDVGSQLRRDRYRFLDDKMMNDIINAATAAAYVTRPDNVAANANFSAAGNEGQTFDMIVNMGKAMKDRNIPGIGGQALYPHVLSTTAMAQLKLDPQYQRLSVFEDKYNPLFPGYVRTLDSSILIESTRVPTIANQGAGSNVTLYQSIMMAPQAYGWALARNARVLRNRNDDGGRNNEFGWSSYEGLDALDARFFQVGITD